MQMQMQMPRTAHRQSARAAASTFQADDQAFVDAISADGDDGDCT
jgi:hypothetical protein